MIIGDQRVFVPGDFVLELWDREGNRLDIDSVEIMEGKRVVAIVNTQETEGIPL